MIKIKRANQKIYLCLIIALTGCLSKTEVSLKSLAVTQTNSITITKVVAGYFHTCVIFSDASSKCFGWNGDGQLGKNNVIDLGDNPGEMGDQLLAIDVGSGLGVSDFTGGQDFTCARLNNSSTKCWGDNWVGILGLGDVISRGDNPGEMGDSLPALDLGTGKTIVQMSSGYYFVCALLNDASVKCWGRNSSGQLGQENVGDLGDAPGEMGNALLAINLGTGKTAVKVAAGGDHACAILNDGSVKCWGYNSSGQLGQGSIADLGDGAGEMGDALLAVNLGTGKTATEIAAGREHTCAILNDETLKCWGNNDHGQLGVGSFTYLGDNGGEMGDALLPIDLGTGRKAIQLAVGGDHNCALLDNATVKCWGDNFFGELGQESTGDVGDNPGEMGDALIPINLGSGRTALQITSGEDHVCALLDNNSVKCWGYNGNGQLGLGNTNDIGDDPGEMGNSLPALQL